jgi:hypothetical protein
MKSFYFISLLFFTGTVSSVHAQSDKTQLSGHTVLSTIKTDSTPGTRTPVPPKPDSLAKSKHIPRIATLRSAILPGLGQAYNHEYWKIPIVYGVLAIPTYAYFYNNGFYNKTKFAYDAVFAATNGDSSKLPLIDKTVKRSDGTPLGLADYQNYRNQFRRDRDYSVLWFLIVWGVNVADATVFAHLKNFDVSNDFTMQVQPIFNNATRTPGIGLVVNLKDKTTRHLFNPSR